MNPEHPDPRIERLRQERQEIQQLRRELRQLRREPRQLRQELAQARQELRQARRELASKDRRQASQDEQITNLRALLAKRDSGNEGYGVKPQNVVWIFGSGRTGSTWLSLMMEELPDHTRWNEPNVGLVFGHPYYNRYQQALHHGRVDRGTFILADGFRKFWLSSIRSLALNGAAVRHPEVANKGGYLVIKEPHGSVGAPLLMEAVPESRMIFLVRDPRDVAASALHTSVARLNPERKKVAAVRPNEFVLERAETYLQDITLTKRAYEAHAGRKVLIRYEDLKADTLATMKRIYSALEIPVEDQELAQAVHKYAWENVPEEKKGPGTVRRRGTSGGWREDLTPSQVEIVQSVTAPILEEFYGLTRETPATGRVDIGAVRRAYEQRDFDLMISFYAEEAQLRIVNSLHPPSNPYELSGKEQIASLLRRLLVRDTKHNLYREVVGNDRMAFHVMQEYRDGSRLLAATVLELDERGKIAQHLEVQVFDE